MGEEEPWAREVTATPMVKYLLQDVGIKRTKGIRVGDVIVGGLVAIALVALAVGLGRALLRASAHDAEATGELVGALATVVTAISHEGPGEVTIAQSDQWLRVGASADGTIATGATVVVVDVSSPTEVVVAESGF